MFKLATFRGIADTGEPLVQAFRQGESIKKVAGTMMPDVQNWLNGYKSDREKIALLINAMGATEYYGQNINGDIFYEASLVHDCRNHPSDMHPVDDLTSKIIPPYGHWTFLQAFPFVHHRNKDPSRAFGKVVVSCWNPRMHRVELVSVLDRAAALQNGAQAVVDRIDAGEYPDVSMGCKVPWDRCVICGHKSKTREDYCPCVKEIGLGKILDDGRQVGVDNVYPRFFDISFVFIGADKTAKVMTKLGSVWAPQSVVDGEWIYGKDGLMKAAEGLPTNENEKPGSIRRNWLSEIPLGNGEPKFFNVRGEDDEERKKRLRERMTRDTTDNLIFGRWDGQGESSAVGDGILATNMNTYAGEDPYEKVSAAPISAEQARQLMRDIGAPLDKYDIEEVRHGIPVELEHANTGKPYTSAIKGDKETVMHQATRICLAHLDEIPDYYTRLKKMEDSAKKKEAAPDMKMVFDKAKDIKIGPPPMPNRKEYPFVGSINFRGIEIFVENVQGSWRTGKNWKTLMKLPYGEFAKTKGMDGDKLDVYVGPFTDAPNIYVIHQADPRTGDYDEDKVMLGFKCAESAKLAYLAHYDNPKYLRSVTTMAFPLFKRALLGGEMNGEKVAGIKEELTKVAADMRLEDLFENRVGRVYRDRTWKNKETGKEFHKHQSGMGNWETVKTASARQPLEPAELLKISDQQKWADIVKEIGPDKAVGKVSPLLSESEPSIPPEVLREMGKADLSSALATPSMLGMVLKPEEFQQLVMPHLAGPGDQESDRVFQPCGGEERAMSEPLSTDHFAEDIANSLMPQLDDKSYFGPVVRRRIIKIIIANMPSNPAASTEPNSPLLSKVAAAYNWYRREQMKLAASAPEFISKRADLQAKILGLNDVDIFSKTAENMLGPKQLAITLGSVPLTLMYSAHLRDQERLGRQLGFMEQMVAGHPWFTTVGVAGVLRELLKTPQAQRVLGGAAQNAVQQVTKVV